MVRRKEKRKQQGIASQRMEVLFDLAGKEVLDGNLKRADRYIELARNIGMKYNVRIPKVHKRSFCKYCYHYLLPGTTSGVRLKSNQHRVAIRCFNCGKTMFFPYVREIKERRRERGQKKN